MKKAISFILVLVMLVGGSIACFAASDTTGTAYDEAVNSLVKKGYISGYTDGTYRPEQTVTRAEACSIIVKFVGATDADLKAAKPASFSDMGDHAWAQPAVNYAVENGILSGYKDGTFRPANEVTYAELSVMVVNAMGQKEKVTGQWATGYIQVASSQGYLLNTVNLNATKDVYTPATRGNVAIIVYNADQKKNPVNEDDKDKNDDTNKGTTVLSDYSGYAYGAINAYAQGLNKDDESVTEIEFVFGDGIQNLFAKKSYTPENDLVFDGTLYCLKLNKGEVTKVATQGAFTSGELNVRQFKEITAGYDKVTRRESNRVIYTETYDGAIELNDDQLSIYVATVDGKDAKGEDAKVDGYRPGTYSDIRTGDFVRVYDVTKDDDFGDVVFVLKN